MRKEASRRSKSKSFPVAEPTNKLITSQVEQVTLISAKILAFILSLLHSYPYQFPPSVRPERRQFRPFCLVLRAPEAHHPRRETVARRAPATISSAALHCDCSCPCSDRETQIIRESKSSATPSVRRLMRNAQSTRQIPTAFQQPQSRLFDTPRRPT